MDVGPRENKYPFLLPKARNIELLDILIQSTPLTFGSNVTAFHAIVDLLILAVSLSNDTSVFADWGKVSELSSPDRVPRGLAEVDDFKRRGGRICSPAPGEQCSFGRYCHAARGSYEEGNTLTLYSSLNKEQMFFSLQAISKVRGHRELGHNILLGLSTKAKETLWICLESWLVANAEPLAQAAHIERGLDQAPLVMRRNALSVVIRNVVVMACQSDVMRTSQRDDGAKTFEIISAVIVQPGERFHPATRRDTRGDEDVPPDFQTVYMPIFTEAQIDFFSSVSGVEWVEVEDAAQATTGKYFRGAYDSAAQSGTLTVRFPNKTEPKGDLRASCLGVLDEADKKRRDLVLDAWEKHHCAGYAEVMVPIHVSGSVSVILCAQINRDNAEAALHFYGDIIPVLSSKIRSVLLSQYCYEVITAVTSLEGDLESKNDRLKNLSWVYPFDYYQIDRHAEDGHSVISNTLWKRDMDRGDAETEAALLQLKDSVKRRVLGSGQAADPLTRAGRNILESACEFLFETKRALDRGNHNLEKPPRILSHRDAIEFLCKATLAFFFKSARKKRPYRTVDLLRLGYGSGSGQALTLIRGRVSSCRTKGAIDVAPRLSTIDKCLGEIWDFLDAAWFVRQGIATSGATKEDIRVALEKIVAQHIPREGRSGQAIAP